MNERTKDNETRNAILDARQNRLDSREDAFEKSLISLEARMQAFQTSLEDLKNVVSQILNISENTVRLQEKQSAQGKYIDRVLERVDEVNNKLDNYVSKNNDTDKKLSNLTSRIYGGAAVTVVLIGIVQGIIFYDINNRDSKMALMEEKLQTVISEVAVCKDRLTR